MTRPTLDPDRGEERLHALIADYLDREAAGQPPPRDAWLAEHAEFAAELRQFLDEHERLARLGAPLRALAVPGAGSDAATLDGTAADTAEAPAVVRSFGDYELLAEVARGGMGVVYKARQKSLDRPVAVKMILGGQLATGTEVERFRTEANAAGNLDHPNIVPIYDVGAVEGQHYYSMKLIAGDNLARAVAADRWPRQTREGRRAIARLVAQAARAVHYAHQRGILHRDLKPGNILLDRAGVPHLTDFGLAKRVGADSSLTHTGAVLGTPSYMPPEQAAGKKQLTTAADVYSLGAILYEMLTGQPPFRGDSPLEVMLQVREREPATPRQSNPGLEADLQTICLKCLEKDPARRYASAEALAEDLDRWLAGDPIAARPSTTWERALKWARRRPALAALVLVCLLSAALLLIGGLWFNAELQIALGQAQHKQRDLDAAKQDLEQTKAKLDGLIARANSMRLVAHAEVVRPKDPGLSLLLAIEAARLGPRYAAQNNALAQGLAVCREVGRLLQPGDGFDIRMVHWFADGRRILTVSGTYVRIWDARTGQKLVEFDGPRLRINSFAVSPDEKWIALTFLEHWESTAVRIGGKIDRNPFVVTDLVARVYDARTGVETLVLRGHENRVTSVAFSPDSRRIVTASADRTARIWDAQTGNPLQVLEGHECGIESAEFTADDRVLTASSGFRYQGSPLKALLKRYPPHAIDPPLPGPFDILGGGGGSVAQGGGSLGELLFACVWDTQTGMRVAEYGSARRRETEFPRHARLDPQGRFLVATNYEGALVWHTQTRTESQSIKLPTDRPQPPGFSADGQRLLVWSAREARVVTLKEGRELAAIRGEFLSARFSPGPGRYVVTTGADGTTRLWDAVGGRERMVLRGHEQGVVVAAFSPDGRRLVTGSNDRTARIWNVEPRLEYGRTVDPEARTEQLPAPGPAWAFRTNRPRATWAAALSPDGRRVATGSFDGTLRLWDVASGKLQVERQGYDKLLAPPLLRQVLGAIDCVAYNRDGSRVLVVSDDTRAGVAVGKGKTAEALPYHPVRVYDTATAELACTLEGDFGNVDTAHFSPDGSRLLTVPNGQPVLRMTVDASGMPLDADNKGPRASSVQVFDARTGKRLHVLAGDWIEVYGACWDPRGERICTVHDHWHIRLWDAATGKLLRTLVDPDGNVNAAAFSPDGRRLLTWSDTRRRQQHNKGSRDVPAHVWDLDRGQPLFTLRGARGTVGFAAFSPDGRWIVTTGYSANSWSSSSATGRRSRTGDDYYADRTARLWEAETGTLYRSLRGHERSIHQAEFSRDGKWLVTASEDRTARVWEVATGKEYITLAGHDDAVKAATFGPDPGTVLTVSWDGTARLWPVDPLPLAEARRPRALTGEERERFEVPGPP